MSSAYTEQDLQRAKSFVIGAGRPIFESELAAEFSRIRLEARAGMREACAKIADEAASFYENARGQHNLKPEWNVQRLKGARNEAECVAKMIRSLPDLAADEAIERIKREARLEEAKWWWGMFTNGAPAVCDRRIAALEGKEPSHV